MSHHPLFVITRLTQEDFAKSPDAVLRQMAGQAGNAAAELAESMTRSGDGQPRPQALAVGCSQHRFIQGEQRANGQVPSRQQMTEQEPMQFWSEAKGRHADPARTPASVLANSWNSTTELLSLALRTLRDNRPIFPSALIEPDGSYTHHLGFPEADVFGDTAPGGAAALYLADHAAAWLAARQPLRDIAQAHFRAGYIRTLHRWPGRLVIALDWNMGTPD